MRQKPPAPQPAPDSAGASFPGVIAVTVRDLWEACLRLLFPVPCLLCAGPLGAGAAAQVCGPCWASLPRLPENGCATCGRPLGGAGGVPDAPGDSPLRCGACQRRQPPYELARAVLPYRDAGPVRALLLALKHGRRRALAVPLARLMHAAAAGRLDLTAFDALVPVPLHWRRRRERGFNQAAALAEGLGRAAGRPVLRRGLVRARPTPPQSGDRMARRRNVRGAFAVRGTPRGIRAKRLLLIDDVFTTGATAEECARVLRRAGAAAVGVYTLARVA